MGDSATDILAIFSEAVALESAEARKEYLDRVCGDDQKARQQVETLLRAHFDAGNFLGGRSLYRTATYVPPVMEQPGDQIGAYKLLQQIGEGGFGVVYMAEQTAPVRRKVALKIIKPGMDSKQVVARFEAERQALALMTHPNIAQVFDGGLTTSGRPYFVMELVRGVPLTDYCEQNGLAVETRLELFVSVCRAIHHAHQKGVIHRDIKPSNVMVTLHDGEPVVKVIDFGISKAIGQQLTEKTMFTAYGQMIGTPAYMSPEQAETSGLDTDIRSDIYSLGVLLYELLTGTTPLERERVKSAGFAELQRMVREEEAPRPSTRLSTLAGTATARANHRGTNFKRLLKLVRGDLDWIVMKSLEKDRNRRYETALSFAEDVERFLRQEPIEARPPSAVYRLQKFVRRNRVALSWIGTTAVLALILIVAVDAIMRSQDREQGLTKELQGKTAEVRLKDTEAKRRKWARDALPRIIELKERKQVVSALKLAREVQGVSPQDPAFLSLWEELTVDTTVDSDPPGARVSIRDWNAVDGEWLEIGKTPLTDCRLPAGPVRFRFAKEGFTSRESQRSLPGSPWTHLSPETESPEMVGIPLLTIEDDDDKRTLSPFLIDKFEVTNRDYQAFADAGGYENREYWKEPFVNERGKSVAWDDAMKEFVDETGQQGPKLWRNGRYPDSEGDYPVRGVSWYEAMAYARFANKWLPTIHHWSWASYGENEYIRPLSNLNGRGPEPVGQNQGIGVFGVYDMGGNVKEWCFNQYGEHDRMLSGADWRSPSYMLRGRDHAPPMTRDETYGFRCVRYYDSKGILWAFRRQEVKEPGRIPSATDEEIQEYLRLFEYDRNLPLNAVLKTRDLPPDVDGLLHEIVQLNTAYGEERFDVHLLIPRRGDAPFQTIVWFPGIGSMQKQNLEEYQTRREFQYVRALAMTGRIVCLPVYKGTFDRAHTAPIRSMRDWRVQLVKDLSRAIDYLETRSDVDHETLVYVGLSMGASFAPCHLVAEPRLKSAVLIAAGPSADKPPEGSSMRYAAHVKVPVLILNGQFDTRFPYQEEQLPFFERLGSADKHLEEFPSGHAPPVDDAVRVADKWLRDHSPHESD
jgi:serine/threonine protein kinase/dienelactone hydrolase